MKNLMLLLMLALTFSCAQQQVVKHGIDGTVQQLATDKEIQEVENVPTTRDLELLEIKSFKGFTKAEMGRFWQYSKIVDEVTHSECFGNYIKNYPGLLNNRDETRDELLHRLRTIKPKLNLVMYYKNNRTVGYTYANSDTIWMNRKFHGGYSLHQSAANLAHERAHKLGYTHDFKRTSRRPNQVPYPVGAGIKKCSQDINYDIKEAERVRVCHRIWWTLWIKKSCYWKLK